MGNPISYFLCALNCYLDLTKRRNLNDFWKKAYHFLNYVV